MKQAAKQEIILHVHLFRELVSRKYRLDDDADPVVEIRGLPSSSRSFVAGTYSPYTNTITLSPSNASCDTIAHELAHWVQFTQRGDTDCYSTPFNRRDHDLAAEHAQMQQAIANLMQLSGYDAAINALWA